MGAPPNPNQPQGPGAQGVARAQVVFGTVNVADELAKIATDGDGEAWVGYEIMCRYVKPHHVYLMPVASPAGFQGQSAAFVQLHAPTMLWVADWTAARWRRQPPIPDPTPRDQRWVLMDELVEPANPVLAGDGETAMYRISGTYVYGCKNPSATTVDDVNFPRPAFMQDSIENGFGMPSSLLVNTLLQPTGRGVLLNRVR